MLSAISERIVGCASGDARCASSRMAIPWLVVAAPHVRGAQQHARGERRVERAVRDEHVADHLDRVVGAVDAQQRARAQQRELRHHVDVVRAHAVAQRETAFEIAREPRAHRFGERRTARPGVRHELVRKSHHTQARGGRPKTALPCLRGNLRHGGPHSGTTSARLPPMTSYGAGGGVGVGRRRRVRPRDGLGNATPVAGRCPRSLRLPGPGAPRR